MLFKTYARYQKDHSQDVFEEKTYQEYLKEASSFIKFVVGEEAKNIKTRKQMREILNNNHELISEYLKIISHSKSSNTWRKLRRSLEVAFKASRLSEKSKLIKEIKNPAPENIRPKNKNRKRRLSKVDDNTYYTVLQDRIDNKDIDSSALIIICKNLGIRPTEAKNIKIIKATSESITVFINGAKKTLYGKRNKKNTRGVDRLLRVNYEKSLEYALLAIQGIDDKRIKAAQMRISRASRKLYPKRKSHFCLYSLRYQYGSDLKKNLTTNTPDSRKRIAAIMGHKNTSSISSYGDSVSGNSGFIPPAVHSRCLAEVNDDYDKHYKAKEELTLTLNTKTQPSYNDNQQSGPEMG